MNYNFEKQGYEPKDGTKVDIVTMPIETTVSQTIAKPNVMRRQSWVCNCCGFSDYTDAVTEQELEEWLQCSNCGGDEFHLEPVIGGA